MNRRVFLSALASLPLAGGLSAGDGLPDVLSVEDTLRLRVRVYVYLNGVRERYCYYADRANGYLESYAMDHAGQPMLDATGEGLVRQYKRGVVTFRIADRNYC